MQQYREASPERSQLLRILTHVLFGLEAIDEELVFKCSEKIYEEEPALVLRCFVDDKGVIGHLNIYHTAQHLQRLTQREPSAYRRNALPIQYLSVVTPHIPAGTGSLRLPEDHNLAQILALLYIETINEAEAFCRQNEHENENQNPNQSFINMDKAKEHLMLSFVPEHILCREAERADIYNYLHNSILQKGNGSPLYISGRFLMV